MTVEQVVDEMRIAGSATPGANGELASDARVRSPGEGRYHLAPRMQPLDTAAARRIGVAVELSPAMPWIL